MKLNNIKLVAAIAAAIPAVRAGPADPNRGGFATDSVSKVIGIKRCGEFAYTAGHEATSHFLSAKCYGEPPGSSSGPAKPHPVTLDLDICIQNTYGTLTWMAPGFTPGGKSLTCEDCHLDGGTKLTCSCNTGIDNVMETSSIELNDHVYVATKYPNLGCFGVLGSGPFEGATDNNP